ncbi:glycoside hydrolase family 127 protein [Paracoccus sp. (in: a-proteobacteria)]|uniref:glycoside hydrolase family 127 protein n=1 Tax=Paracoccus sp. TaxID=267 RepID=UPI003A8AE8D9
MNNTQAAVGHPAKFRPLKINQVRVDGFFGPRIDQIAIKTARMLFDRCIAAGMLDQIDPDRPNPGMRIPFQNNHEVTPQMFWDSDLGKSIEAAAYALFRRADPDLEAQVDEVVDAFGRLQDDDGYLNSWFQRMEPGKRWTNLREKHELYNAGHLIEAAVAYFHATGKRKLLDIMGRYADHIARRFGPDKDQSHGYPGHPELELALVKLARATGRQDYLDLAKYFVDARGTEPNFFDDEARGRGERPEDFAFGTLEYCQAHKPVRDQTEVVGHAVRAAYLYAGMADVATEFADDSLDPALEALGSHLTERNLYVTGGFGPSALNEGLTFDYDLPNRTAYAETCASVALVFWASRMLGRGPDARFADVMERVLYNGALSGLSLDGERFFYDNPLESRGDHHRWHWHRCPCCPPNISRLIASVGTCLFGVSDTEIALHLYCGSQAEISVAGTDVALRVETDYPVSGRIRVRVDPVAPADFTLSLRIPGWASDHAAAVNGDSIDLPVERGYLRITRRWQAGDEIALDLGMEPQFIHANPAVAADQGRVALMRGPLVYCLEQADNAPMLNSCILRDDAVPRLTEINGLPGIVGLEVEGMRETGNGALYSTTPPRRAPTLLRAVPYYAWDNRAPGEMLVWIRREA